jgi:peptide/nickel transport system permease protein
MSRQTSLRFYVVKRILQAVPLVLAIIIFNFVLIHSAPGDPLYIIIGEEYAELDPEFVAKIRAEYGLDQPIYVQLFAYLSKIVRLDFGFSFSSRMPVIDIIASRIGPTLLLMTTGIAIGLLMGIVLGVLSSRKPYSTSDNLITSGSLIFYSVPSFWLAQMLALVLALHLNLFPAQGMITGRFPLTGFAYVADVLHHLALPALTIGMFQLAVATRLTRASMLEVLRTDFITEARAKGLGERKVLLRHGLRNALLPVVTTTGMSIAFIFGGAVLTETVFGWPGMGRLMYDSIYRRDYPVLMGIFILVSSMVIVGQLITDILYAWLDPRIRYR